MSFPLKAQPGDRRHFFTRLQNVVTWPRLAAREAGEYIQSLAG